MKMSRLPVRTPRLLIVGSGDIAWRALPWLRQHFRVMTLCHSPATAARWREAGALPVLADLDHGPSLRRLAGIADYVLHAAPPATDQTGDPRMRRLLAALGTARIIPRALVYISTTGVYGDCGGNLIDETRTRRAQSARAQRRVGAENALRGWLRQRAGRAVGRRVPRLVILRVPGIYAAERLPLQRLRKATPAVRASEDAYSNHIHADDLARAFTLARARAQRPGISCLRRRPAENGGLV